MGWYLLVIRPAGICRSVSHFSMWIDYNGIVLTIELLAWGHTFLAFWGLENSGKQGLLLPLNFVTILPNVTTDGVYS